MMRPGSDLETARMLSQVAWYSFWVGVPVGIVIGVGATLVGVALL